MSTALHQRAKADPRMDASTKDSNKGWFWFELGSAADLREALYWLNQA